MDLEELLRAAVLAPSSHNTQPWIFQARPPTIRLYADRKRALPANDPHDRELTISCGCALFNIRVAAAANRLEPVVTVLPDSQNADLLAEVGLAPLRKEFEEIGELSVEITRRRTYRRRFEDRDVSEKILEKLSHAVTAEGAAMRVIDKDDEKKSIVRLVSEGDSRQWSDPIWRRELARWLHSRREGDGLTVPALVAPVARTMIRTFDMGNAVAAKNRQLAECSPVLVVLATSGDTPEHWLACGQALERCLLTASRHGLQASYMNQPIQVSSLRAELRKSIGSKLFPQILLRLGYPSENIDAAPRRELDEVVNAS